MTLFGRRWPVPLFGTMKPFIIGSLVVLYGLNKIEDAGQATPPFDLDPRNPRDEETRVKAQRVIDAQFDLEILLRHRELQKIKEELKKAELTLETLRHCILEPTPSNANKDSTCSAKTFNKVSEIPSTRHSTRKIYSTRDNDYFYYDPCKDLYSRRNDGIFVRLSCPQCNRAKFINVQGFLNHCRLSHKIEFPNHEEALLNCGTPVDESLIPPEHPARSRVITRPPSLRTILGQTNLSKNLTRVCPKIKVFEEEIDVGLEESLHKNQESAFNVDSHNSRSLDNQESSTTSRCSTDQNQFNKTIENIEYNLPEKSFLGGHRSSFGTMEIQRDSEDGPNDQINTLMDIDTDNTDNLAADTSSKKPRHELSNDMVISNANMQKEITTISAAYTIPARNSVFDPIDHGSRFYVKRRIVVGNVSKWIAPEKRDPNLFKYTHKWMVYVTGPPYDLNISPFIQRVRFFLHPSYRPMDIVDVTEPPFQLIRYGWGEFPIRIQLIFVDKKNKPVDVIHVLKLDEAHSGKQRLGNERAFDLELDRNTHFVSPRSKNQLSHTVNKVQDRPQQELSDVNHFDIGIGNESSMNKEQNDNFESDDLKILESLLIEAAQQYPLIVSSSLLFSHSLTFSYSTATSARMFLEWDSEHRKKTELHRARLIRLYILSLAQKMGDPSVMQAAVSVTTKQVISWCRDKGYTPLDRDSTYSNSITNDIASSSHLFEKIHPTTTAPIIPTWCKCCGCPESWHETSISNSTKNVAVPLLPYKCKRRPHFLDTKKTRLRSLTIAQDFLGELVEVDQVGEEAINIEDIATDRPFNNSSHLNGMPSIDSKKDVKEFGDWYKTDMTDVSDPQGIDWIWSVIDQLKLSGVMATKLICDSGGKVLVENGDANIAIKQRLETGNLIFQLTKVFLKDLINKSVKIYNAELLDDQFAPDNRSFNNFTFDTYLRRSRKLLVPYHLYQAVQTNLDTFDFLNGEGLASDRNYDKSQIKKTETL
ncbi:16589_t:CDS:10 [Acaulospora morrowiae]|uniref:16589_t:CDS:1 n=1 Tax=Acaulospora morrowiae TaxID=94023 RepID=A0A9N8VPD5_9GLOM|nr:16589_t:CDS:10 [Acaulospora morrowiae]